MAATEDYFCDSLELVQEEPNYLYLFDDVIWWHMMSRYEVAVLCFHVFLESGPWLNSG